MRTNTLKSLTIALLACTLFASCNKEKIIVDKDTLIQEMIDTLLFHQERYEGDAMLTTLDSLKSLGAEVNNMALLYATAYGFKGEYDYAIQLLKNSIPSSGKPQLLYQEMGSLFLLKGDVVEAINAYNEAIKCNPYYARPYICLAEIFEKQSKNELAVNHYLNAVRLFYENGFYEEMGYYANRALLLDSTNVELKNYLTLYYTAENEY
jgi:tetratricopeptide (TPR) repeat protein